MKKLQVDRGAIRFVLAGANIMCPGLTSPGGCLDEEVAAETPVVHNMIKIHSTYFLAQIIVPIFSSFSYVYLIKIGLVLLIMKLIFKEQDIFRCT